MSEDLVGWIAALFALLGSGLLAMNSLRWSRWAYFTGAMHLLVQNIGFTLTSVYGVYGWFRSDLGTHRVSRFKRWLSSALISAQVIELGWAAARMPRTR